MMTCPLPAVMPVKHLEQMVITGSLPEIIMGIMDSLEFSSI